MFESLEKENEFLKKKVEELENRFGLVWKNKEEQFLKIINDNEIIFGDKKFILDNNLSIKEFGKSKKKELVNNSTNEILKIKREKGESFLYFCEKLNSLIVIYSNNVYKFVENDYTDYYPVLVKKGDKFGFGEVRDNLLIEGDNYYALQVLQYTHREKIDVIYIDPPYNTGNNYFKYNDNYISNEDGGRHSKWLSFMEKRLRLAKNLLSEDGLIFISIDDLEYANLKLLCDNIFNDSNFVANFTRKTSNGPKKAKPNIDKHHDYVLCYSKNIQVVNIDGGDKEFEQYNNPDNDINGDWVKDSLIINIDAGRSAVNGRYAIHNPYLDITHYPPVHYNENNRKQWHYTEKIFNEKIKNGQVVFYKDKNYKGEYSFYIKKYKKDLKKTTNNLSTLFSVTSEFTNSNGTIDLNKIFNNKIFDGPKPISLIKKLISSCGKNNITVLDFFAGSGTTGHAVVQLNKEDGGNRKFILVTNNENNICEDVTYERLARINNPQKYNLNIEGLPHGLEYLQIKHVKNK